MQLCGIKVIYLLVQFFGEVDICMNLLQYFCTGVDVESPAERLVTLTDKKYENQPQYDDGATNMEIPHELLAPESHTSPENDTGPANTSDSFLNKSNTVFDLCDDEEVREAINSRAFLPRGRSFQKRADKFKEKEERDQVSGGWCFIYMYGESRHFLIWVSIS